MFKKLGLTIKEYRTNKIFRFFVGLITILVAQICCGLYFRNIFDREYLEYCLVFIVFYVLSFAIAASFRPKC
jgi:hypothetical protein